MILKQLKRFAIALLLVPAVALACSGWVIGFRGQNEVFDYEAFADYATDQGLCWRSFGWQDSAEAHRFIQRISTPYQLYGFSRGAETVAAMLRQGRVRPQSVITVGAYRTVDVNFDRYGIPYRNYFDRSGRGQRSPGVFLDVEHHRAQRAVTEILKHTKYVGASPSWLRHRILIPTCIGSNPIAPAKFF